MPDLIVEAWHSECGACGYGAGGWAQSPAEQRGPILGPASRVCPGCGREDSVPLRWGLPAVEDFRLAERGLVALGGCLVPGEEPVLSCRSSARCGLSVVARKRYS